VESTPVGVEKQKLDRFRLVANLEIFEESPQYEYHPHLAKAEISEGGNRSRRRVQPGNEGK